MFHWFFMKFHWCFIVSSLILWFSSIFIGVPSVFHLCSLAFPWFLLNFILFTTMRAIQTLRLPFIHRSNRPISTTMVATEMPNIFFANLHQFLPHVFIMYLLLKFHLYLYYTVSNKRSQPTKTSTPIFFWTKR